MSTPAYKTKQTGTKPPNWVWGPVCDCGTQCVCPFGYKIRCTDFYNSGKCPHGNKCRFAHY